MNDDERRIITQFVERVAGVTAAAPASGNPWGGGSVPNTQGGTSQARPNLPPVDRDADALIADLFSRHPEARYRLTQTAFVQDAALVEAQNRIRQLEWEVQNAQSEAQGAAQPQRGGLFGMFGGGGGARPNQNRMPPPPQPVYPPNHNPAALQQRGGSGFLGTALTTAAGVAGGMVLGNMLMNSLSGHGGSAAAATADAGSAASGAGDFGQEAVPASSPWTDPGAAAAENGWGTDSAQNSNQSSDWGGGADGASGGYDTDVADAGGGYDEDV